MRGAVLAVLLALASAPAVAGDISGPAAVIDGDTLAIGRERVRLFGIDAPELAQSCATVAGGEWNCGAAASARLAELATGRKVACAVRERDRYRRLVAVCRVDGIDLGRVLAAEGLAWAFRRYAHDYVTAETDARELGAGLWQAATATAWDFRASARRDAPSGAPGECRIKGNIGGDGARIYHTPRSPWYARTRIDAGAGERWFCDAAEARAAGWRQARAG